MKTERMSKQKEIAVILPYIPMDFFFSSHPDVLLSYLDKWGKRSEPFKKRGGENGKKGKMTEKYIRPCTGLGKIFQWKIQYFSIFTCEDGGRNLIEAYHRQNDGSEDDKFHGSPQQQNWQSGLKPKKGDQKLGLACGVLRWPSIPNPEKREGKRNKIRK